MNTNSYSDMELFASIAKNGGIRKAADRLSLTRSTLSRRLSQMEDRLGIRLIERSTRQFKVSEAGKIYAAYCMQSNELRKQAEWSLSNFRDQASGLLRITAPVNYGESVIQPIVCSFLKAHPQVDVEILLADSVLDVIDDGIDVALRLGPLPDSEMHAKLVDTEKKLLCCSKAYIQEHGRPQNPDQLEDHWCIRYGLGKDEVWEFDNGEETITLRPKGRIVVNDIAATKQALMSDLGFAFLPQFLCKAELESGALVSLFDEWIEPDLLMYALYPQRDLVPKKVTAFVEFLSDALS